MANHKSAEKRARQNVKRASRNASVRSAVKSAIKNARASTTENQAANLSQAFSVIQKSRGVFHRNSVRRKMARTAKALAKKS